MNDLTKEAVTQLAKLFSWTVYAFIAYVGPGLITLSLVPLVFPNNVLDFGGDKLHVGLILIWAIAIGLILSALGAFIFGYSIQLLKLTDWLSKSFIREQASVTLGAVDLVEFLNSLTPAQRQNIETLPAGEFQRRLLEWSHQRVRLLINRGAYNSFAVFTTGIGISTELQGSLASSQCQLTFTYGLYGLSLSNAAFNIYRSLETHTCWPILWSSAIVAVLWLVSLIMFAGFHYARLGTFMGIANSPTVAR